MNTDIQKKSYFAQLAVALKQTNGITNFAAMYTVAHTNKSSTRPEDPSIAFKSKIVKRKNNFSTIKTIKAL
jgi:hypothetical protein